MSDLKPPVVYQANPLTGEYAGQYYADPDPLDEGNWLIPGMAFTVAPPKAKKGFAAVHVLGQEETWSLMQDLRGLVYQTDTGLETTWDQFGPLPETLTSEPRPSPYHSWRDGGWHLDVNAQMEALKQLALDARDGLLRDATTRIAPLQDAVDMEDATEGEAAQLKVWKRYRVDLNRIQLQPGFPGSIDWPTMPNFAPTQ